MKKDLLTILDLEKEEIIALFRQANHLRKLMREGETHRPLRGKTLALIFEKPSTRTRLSFEVGMYQLGGYPLVISSNQMQLSRGETLEDTARIFSRYVDGLMIRTFQHSQLEKIARTASIPIINGLTDSFHPCQALSDYYTLWRRKENLSGLKLAYLGDGNNVSHSLMLGAARLGVEICICTPPGYEPAEKIQETVRGMGASFSLIRDPAEAVTGVDVIYTDVWASMGKEQELPLRAQIFRPYQVNSSLLSRARENVLVMHCLPAHRGQEITDEVMDGPNSIVFEQAENRLHLQKALLVKLLSHQK